jgi:Na+-transporting NADH:ubiquinone oxidoreductase subunit NqrF
MFNAARLCHVTLRGPYTNNFPKQKTCTKFLFVIFGASNNNKRSHERTYLHFAQHQL